MKKFGKRITAFILAVMLAVLPAASGTGGALTSFAEGQSTIRTLFYGNLLKEGSSFTFYGKDVPRNGMWAYQINSNPVFCLEPTKKMYNGATGQIEWYELDGGDLPYGITTEKAEALYYAMASGGCFENSSANLAKTKGGYMMMQSAVWAIMSDEWDIEKFMSEMERKIIPNAKDSAAAPIIRQFATEYVLNAQDMVRENVCPAFASRYPNQAPSHQMIQSEDGTYTFTFSTDGSWMQNELVYDVPDGWEYCKAGNEITFTCKNGNPNSGVIKGYFPEGSGAARYWYRPTKLAIVSPVGGDQSQRQAQIMMAGEKMPWEVYFQFGAGGIPDMGEGGFTIPYEWFEHEETFRRNYNIELVKTDQETEKPLEGSTFEVLEKFDFSQLDGTNLEREQFEEPDQEENYHDWSVCVPRIITDEEGHLTHSDEKTYLYHKTYCGGHPDPIIEEVEVGEEASEEESDAADEENERLRELAWEQWQECVDFCEETCDYHSITEGGAREEMEADRNEAYETFIQLKRSYTAREVTARTGYILHDLHHDDIPVETVEFASSQTGDDGVVTGTYPGNRTFTAKDGQEQEKAALQDPPVSISRKETEVLRASLTSPSEATPSLVEEEPDQMELTNDLPTPATPSNAWEARTYDVSVWEGNQREADGGGWTWDGVLLESEVAHINQKERDTGYFGYCFRVADHRTEGEVHINKRDLELYQSDTSDQKADSYGKTQGDATLENAVYGLYAMDDIIHPDGKTGKVFSAGELVAIASTDKNGDASFVVITEISETSANVANRYTDNQNGNCWIGRPLLLGRYYIQEISRSEGYELSKVGINLTESNRTGAVMPFAQAGTVSTGELGHRLNEWDGSFHDVTVQYFKTLSGFDLTVTGYPEGSRFYRVAEQERKSSDHVVIGTQEVEKKDGDGNTVFQTADGGEYKLDAEGNRKLLFDADGNPVYGTEAELKTVCAVNRLGNYIPSIPRNGAEEGKEHAADIDTEYILDQVNGSLLQAGYKDALDFAPWEILELNAGTNGEMIDAILSHCAEDAFWDSLRLDQVYEENGKWYALIRYGYLALKNAAIYEASSGRFFMKQTGMADVGGQEEEVFYYVIYEPGKYTKNGSSVTFAQESAAALEYGRPIVTAPVYKQLYETYAPGEYLLDLAGNRIPVYETQPVYGTISSTEYEEVLTELTDVVFNKETGITTIHVDTSEVDWELEQQAITEIIRAVAPQAHIEIDGQTMAYADYLKEYQGASVSAFATRPPFQEGSYVKEAVLLYPGQWEVHQDAGTRDTPVIVQQRCIKQAIKVTKDIAQDSYEEINTYKIHRDPFTVLFGGFKEAPAKTMKGFFFKLYLRQDLIDTGNLKEKPEGGYAYETFFEENPELAESLAIAWDNPKYDTDGDLTTLHADRGGGKDDYYGTSIMLPYGAYVIVEQQPVTIPTKHYSIDEPKEITLPFVPQIDADGTVHDQVASEKYLYDAAMTPEEMMEQYHIRFHEESHVIYAHNHDGDFLVFKYGLEPDLAADCGNEAVSRYYHYASLSENAGKRDGVYYEVYRDRDGNILDYGITKDGVDTMTGVSTMTDRLYAPALVPWSVLDERYGEIINDQGDVGNREPGLTEDGGFNYVSFAAEDFENHFYGSRLRIEKLDSETGENIIHEGALFKIYAAKRDISGAGTDGVKGSGKVVFLPDGTPDYDEAEQIFLMDSTGAEVGVFKAQSTIRDGEMEVDGEQVTGKQGVGYIVTPQPLGAGVYVLVEVKAPEGYVKSKPVAFEVYSDEVSYYPPDGDGTAVTAPRYQYVKEILPDGREVVEDVSQILVYDKPTHVLVHKVEAGEKTLTYRVDGTEEELKARGDVTLQYEVNGMYAGYGYVTKTFEDWSGETTYVPRATLTLYEGLKLKRTGAHSFEGVTVERNWNDSVVKITAELTGVDTDIRKTGVDSEGNDIWDVTEMRRKPVQLYRYNLKTDPIEVDEENGVMYGLDAYGNRVCFVDSFTGLAYVEDEAGTPIAWPLDEKGKKIKAEQVLERVKPDGGTTIYEDIIPVLDENGLPVYYAAGSAIKAAAEWVTPMNGPYQIARLPVGSYIVEETVTPHAMGYTKSMSIGLVVAETDRVQECYMKDDFTKVEIAKLDSETGREVVGAHLTLYEAERVPDSSDRGWHLEATVDFDGERIPYASWISGYQYDNHGGLILDNQGNRFETTKPHWIDHIPPGDYLLVETSAEEADGYVRAPDVEVIVKETGEVQQFAMYEDHTSVEFTKIDGGTGSALSNKTPARLALYAAMVNEKGEVQYDDNGYPRYDKDRKLFEWVTDDGKAVAETGHEVSGPGWSETVYDYEIHEIPGLKNARYYVTETGAMHIDYLPVGKYVWVEIETPPGMQTAAPIYVPVLETGSQETVQRHEMVNHPIEVTLSKTYAAGGPELAGAVMAVYRADGQGESPKRDKLDEQGNPVPVIDKEGNPVYDMAGNPIMEEFYPESYLVERWTSGTDGRYTEEDALSGAIPTGRSVESLKPHKISGLSAGIYYLVEEQTPFGYARGEEIRFEVSKTGQQWIEMVDYLVQGRLEIQKYDENDPEKPLSGAKFKLENLDTNEALILITGKDGRVATGYLPIGAVSEDGSVSLYRYRLTEVAPPDHYELDPEIHVFSFPYRSDRTERVTYRVGAPNKETIGVISKVDITNQKELPGAKMRMEDLDGNLIEEWVSGTQPHEIVGRLVAGQSYVLIEESAPDGYVVAERITFTVGKDGRIEPIVMKDKPTDVVLSKKSISGEDELPGASMVLKEADGTVIREWISTDEPYRLVGVLIAGKSYILHESMAAEGWAYAEDIHFTVSDDGSMDQVTMRDKPTNVRVSKTDASGLKGLPGAVMEIQDMQGNMVMEWISDGTPKEIQGVLTAGQDYILHEKLPPAGYAYSEDIQFTVGLDGELQELVMKDSPTIVSVSKKAITGEEELPGAKLRIETLDGAIVHEWTSGTEPYVLTGVLKADTDYRLVETAPPDGYAYSEDVIFHVSADGTIDHVDMYDRPTEVVLSKKQITGEEELPGAALQLLDSSRKLVEEWISGQEPHRITGKLKAGEVYYLREAAAPQGWAYAKEVAFTVNKDGSVNEVVMRDRPTHIEIIKRGSDGRDLAGAHLQLQDSSGKVVKAWVSDGETKTIVGELEAGKEYTLIETQAPAGYQTAAPITFTVSEHGDVQVIIMYDRVRPSEGGGGGREPEPSRMSIRKTDSSGARLGGAEITVYREDGSVLLSGMTGIDGALRFSVPADGTYRYRETKAPNGFLVSKFEGTFEVRNGNVVADGLVIENRQAPEVVIRKVDAETKEPLAGARIGVFLGDIQVFDGVTGEDGNLKFRPDVAGSYWYREVESPEGYQVNPASYRFEITEEGSVVGELEIVNHKVQKRIGTIHASYHGSGQFAGTKLQFGGPGKITHGPKTGDNTPLLLYLLTFMTSAFALFSVSFKRRGIKSMAFLLLTAGCVAVMARTSFADERTMEKEQIYQVSDPADAHPDFEDEIVEHGVKYHLIHVGNEILEETDLLPETVTVTSAPFREGAEPPEAEPFYVSDGIRYELLETRVIDSSLTERTKEVSTEVLYEDVEQADQIPEFCYVTVYDEWADESYTRQVPLSNYEFVEYHWTDGFEFPVTFAEYDAEYYTLGNTLIPKNDEKPALEGHYEELMALIGVSSEYYQIEDINWASEPWTGEDGVVYRTATATGQKLVGTCRAVYAGRVDLMDYPAKALEMVYQAPEEGIPQKQYTIQSTATYQAVDSRELEGGQSDEKGLLYRLWEHMKAHPVISIGLALFLLFLITVLMILSRGRRQDREEEGR